MQDYHVHTTYSDGRFLSWMVDAAVDAGLDVVGLADHCNVSTRAAMRRHKYTSGYNLDLTYERRREAIEAVRVDVDITICDGVEMDYDSRDESEIRDFLTDADFEYAIGSVHFVDGVNVHVPEPFRDRTESDRRKLVSDYFDDLESLIRSELFEIAAHVDIVERNEALRGLGREEDYRRIADAFTDSRTVPEINAGRIDADYGSFHPNSAFLDVLLEFDIDVTVGSDSHRPEQLRERVPRIRNLLTSRGIDPVGLQDLR